jgi:hypothetical protein
VVSVRDPYGRNLGFLYRLTIGKNLPYMNENNKTTTVIFLCLPRTYVTHPKIVTDKY